MQRITQIRTKQEKKRKEKKRKEKKRKEKKRKRKRKGFQTHEKIFSIHVVNRKKKKTRRSMKNSSFDKLNFIIVFINSIII
jgi:signal recognition particle GTPase